MSKDNQHKVASRSFQSKNYLEINCFVEHIQKTNYIRYDEAVFFEMCKEYDRNNKIVMQLKSIDLRSMAYALKELIKNGSSQWVKYTDPTTAGSQGFKKSITLRLDNKTVYLNVASGATTIAYTMDMYGAASFADCITLMAEELEREIYRLQRTL